MKKSALVRLLLAAFYLVQMINNVSAQSVARRWNEAQLQCIRWSFARPTVHARALFHTSVAMYDAWAVYDDEARPYLLGNTWGTFAAPFCGIPWVDPSQIQTDQEEALSYAAYRVLRHLYVDNQSMTSNGHLLDVINLLDNLMANTLGYDIGVITTDYSTGNPAALGNYIAQQIILFEAQDGSNQQNNYANQVYKPVNGDIFPNNLGNPLCYNLNRWQRMVLPICQDQSGGAFDTCPGALTLEWSNVVPFSLTSCQSSTIYRDPATYYITPGDKNTPPLADESLHQDSLPWKVYLDPGLPPYIQDTSFTEDSYFGPRVNFFKWGYVTNIIWHSFHANNDGTNIDISPNNVGGLNITSSSELPGTFAEFQNFYDVHNGGVNDPGHSINPITGMPYASQIVPRMDYTRVLAQFWADGPNSETPPGHWYVMANYVSDQPGWEKKWMGEGPVLSDLEWDVRTYFTLGGGLHDAAIACWGVKGAYDYTRPIMAIRKMGELGQCTDPLQPHYHPDGLPLIPSYIELVQPGDPLAGNNNVFVNRVKLFTWRGPFGFQTPAGMWQGTQQDSVGWILAENWWPYQTASFVTPPFPGYYSGHSVYSRTAAEILTRITGSEYFPGGMAEFTAPVDYLIADPAIPLSQPISLQWATYRDASDQCSLSRIYGGLHPPQDDIPGRKVGLIIGNQVVDFANTFIQANPAQVTWIEAQPIAATSASSDFAVNITFDQDMDATVAPTLVIQPAAAANGMTQLGGEWISATTFQAAFNWNDSTAVIPAFSVAASGAIPSALEVYSNCSADTVNAAGCTLSFSITLDLTAPQCSASMPSEVITDLDAGNSFDVSFQFSEAMNQTNFDFSAALGNAFDFMNVDWTSDSTCVAHFTVVDNNEETSINTFASFAGYDVQGNPLSGCTTSQPIEIDTYNPSVALEPVLPDPIFSDEEAVLGQFLLRFNFDDNMDTTTTPSVVFTNDDPMVASFLINSIQWISESTLELNYAAFDAQEELSDIRIVVDNAHDDHGNAMTAAGNFIHPFSIDTRNPEITYVTLSTDTVQSAAALFTITVNYDEPMNTSIPPIVSLSDGVPPLQQSTISWSSDSLSCTIDYTCSTTTTLYSGIDITIDNSATDAAGNVSNDTLLTDALTIDFISVVTENIPGDWLIFPNPVIEGQNLRIRGMQQASGLSVFDARGRLVQEFNVSGLNSASIPTADWSPGIYMLRLTGTAGSSMRQCIVITE